jgi:phospholipase D1/2
VTGCNHILKEGVNCWRIRDARQLAFLVDAEAYFEAFMSAADLAQESIYIAAWDVDSRIKLLRSTRDETKSVQLGRFLNAKVARTPGLQVYILCWDFAMIYAFEREFLPLFNLGWRTHKRIHLHMDDEHPIGASHHQKIVVIDDTLAFCGGIDLTKHRWDTPEHAPHDPHRAGPDGRPYGPFHDVQMFMSGDVAASLADLFRQRWFWATGQGIKPAGTDRRPPWPEGIRSDLSHTPVGIARTFPAYKERQEVREAEALYVDSIAAAKRYIYIENQYLTSALLAKTLGEKLGQRDGPEIVLVLPKQVHGWLEQRTMGAEQGRILGQLFEADRYHRLRTFYPSLTENGDAVFVHAKVMIVDDCLARIGSSNLTNRSMGLDSECDLAIEASDNPAVKTAIGGLRNVLLAEHLGASAESVNKALQEEKSLIQVVERLAGSGRGLKELVPERITSIAGAAGALDTKLPDPEKPIKLDELMDHFVHEEDEGAKKGKLIKLGIVLLLLFAIAASWRWTPLSDWLSSERLATGIIAFKTHSLAPLAVWGGFIIGSLLMVPITLLVGATVIAFAPFLGSLYALVGCFLSSLVTYALGAWIGKDTVRSLAGPKLNFLSKKLSKQGLVTIVIVRNLPIAPFTIVNLVAGASRVKFKDFLLGTVLGMTPGIVAISIFADRLVAAVKEPNWGSIITVVAIATALAVGSWRIQKRLSKDRQS